MKLQGSDNVSLKFFKTGRLQTAGCKSRAQSMFAVQVMCVCVCVCVCVCMGTFMEGGGQVLQDGAPADSRCKSRAQSILLQVIFFCVCLCVCVWLFMIVCLYC